jgi:hypothetical protein
MKKILLAVLAAFAVQTAYADTMTNSGTISASCSISNIADGVMGLGVASVPGDAIGTPGSGGYPAQATVTNNGANQFKISVVQGTLTTPTITAGNRVNNLNPVISDGPNAGATFTGSITSTTREANLANTGQDTFQLNSAIATPGTPLPVGNYSMSYNVTCVAQ